MANNLDNLNDILFQSLRKVMDDKLNKDEIQIEIERTRAVAGTAEKIINAGQLALKAAVVIAAQDASPEQMPELLESIPQRPQKLAPKKPNYKTITAEFDENEYE
ncbi:MAG: hypothetical protein IJ660_00960 [Alphaproteobacteria bacterium]|jgi:ribonuclease PH|nr:hypothetical protein [Alphaproteobacteria bacterium]